MPFDFAIFVGKIKNKSTFEKEWWFEFSNNTEEDAFVKIHNFKCRTTILSNV
jgi:hypothetical protein